MLLIYLMGSSMCSEWLKKAMCNVNIVVYHSECEYACVDKYIL